MQLNRDQGVDAAALIGGISNMWLVDHGYGASIEAALSAMTLADVAAIHLAHKRAIAEAQAHAAAEDEAIVAAGGQPKAANRSPGDDGSESPAKYQVIDGVAYIYMSGPMTKRLNSMAEMFGGVSTMAITAGLKNAAAAGDEGVQDIALVIDSPGGDVSGAFDLADTVYALNKHIPVYCYIQDMGASAGYLVASQGRQVFCNTNAVVGSIGTYITITDSTRRDQMQGIKRHIVYSGENKAIGAPGREVTDDHLAIVQRHTDSMMGLFMKGVMRGRGMDEKQVAKVATGDIHIGKQAKRLGLVDNVVGIEGAHKAILDARPQKRKPAEGGAKGDEMTVTQGNFEDVRRWLAAAEGEAAQAAEPTAQDLATAQAAVNAAALAAQPAQPVAPATVPVQTDSANTLLATLASAGITDVNAFEALRSRAVIGDTYITNLRTQVKQLAIVAFGPTDGATFAAAVDTASVDMLRAMGKQYETIAVQKGLIPPAGGAPMARTTAPGAHPQVGTAQAMPNQRASADTGALPADVAAAHMRERASSGLYSI